MKYLKLYEEFTEFQLDEISKEEYYSILDNNPLVYIPESKVLEFKSKLSKEYKLGYGRGDRKDTVEFFRAEYETEVDYHITSKRFSIKKKSQGVDEPCYIMSYHYEEFTSFAAPQSHIETLPNQERIFFEKKSYYRFEESDFNQMCENPQILLDYLEKDMIKESFKIYEEFNFLEFQPEMISEQEYQRVKKSGVHLRFSTRDVARLYTNAKVFDPRIVSWVDGNIRGYIGGTFNQVIKNVELKFSTRFEIITIEKEDEPFVYFTINWGYRNSMISWRDTLNFPPDSKLYGRMEYEEFEMVREDCKLWKDFCVNVVVEEDRKTNKIIQESLFNEIPDPEIMTLDEYDDEINNGKEEKFNQKEKELFISLSDTILVKHKIDALEIGYSQLSFSMVNGDDGIYPELESTDVIRSITTYKNEDEFYYVNVWEKEWATEDDNGTKSYRCDGYECWEKFLKEIFSGYRKLIG